jgi:predicted nucleic acid-binding protein
VLILQLIWNRSHSVTPLRAIHVTKDPDDNKFVECAEAARADYLVTGSATRRL